MLAQQLPAHEDTARQLLALLERQVAALPTNAQTFGLIHYDFELDNLLWDDQRVSIVDFDDCAGYWFVADIAFALRDLFDDQPAQIDVADARFQAFMAGYRELRSVTDAELRHLALFLRIHNLVSFAKLLRAADIAPTDRAEQVLTIDGVRAEYADGFGLARASNTTPVIVLRFEADTPAALERIKKDFRNALQPLKPDAPLPF
jgi:Ser/Thr protein kinase RdoA (MazF antagonist)